MTVLEAVGREARGTVRFLLMLASLSWGVLLAIPRPSSWRRTVRAEFRRALRQSLGGGLVAILFTAILVGLAMVSQALYWLGTAGQEQLIGPVLVTVLGRELTPVLVGLILVGRSGMAALSELGELRQSGEVRALEGLGVDPFLYLVLPRAAAFALAAFTAGVLFIGAALISGFVAASFLSAAQPTLLDFFDTLIGAMNVADFMIFPIKMLLIGLLVATIASLTALGPRMQAGPTDLLPKGFVRSVLAVMIISVALSLVV